MGCIDISVFGTNSSNKTDNSNSIFGSDPKMSINNFTGTNNSGNILI